MSHHNGFYSHVIFKISYPVVIFSDSKYNDSQDKLIELFIEVVYWLVLSIKGSGGMEGNTCTSYMDIWRNNPLVVLKDRNL